MAQADRQTSTASEGACAHPDNSVKRNPPNILDAQDLLSARLSQMEGILIATANCWDDEDEDFSLPGVHMHNVLWAVRELRDQAEDAYHALVDVLARKVGV